MDSEEPPNVRVACSGDIDEVVRLMHDAAAWMSAKGTPAWDVARIDRTFAETFVLRSELLVASCSDGIVGCCTLSAEDPEFWPDALKGEAAYLHKLAVRRTHAGRGVSSALIEACRHAARTQGCAKLRLDCHPRTRNLTSVRASRSMSGWDGPVASRSLAVRPRCLGCARGCRYLLICTQI
ncbi:GNAT family N-acetyltransferase [Escherichia coli]|uniref:GNAT family N-acetyltransferase n=1 Tax=Escherichia coli TaxID=562 RepID=UPI0033903CA9